MPAPIAAMPRIAAATLLVPRISALSSRTRERCRSVARASSFCVAIPLRRRLSSARSLARISAWICRSPLIPSCAIARDAWPRRCRSRLKLLLAREVWPVRRASAAEAWSRNWIASWMMLLPAMLTPSLGNDGASAAAVAALLWGECGQPRQRLVSAHRDDPVIRQAGGKQTHNQAAPEVAASDKLSRFFFNAALAA